MLLIEEGLGYIGLLVVRVIPVYFWKGYVVETISPYGYIIYYFDVTLRGTAHIQQKKLN